MAEKPALALWQKWLTVRGDVAVIVSHNNDDSATYPWTLYFADGSDDIYTGEGHDNSSNEPNSCSLDKFLGYLDMSENIGSVPTMSLTNEDVVVVLAEYQTRQEHLEGLKQRGDDIAIGMAEKELDEFLNKPFPAKE